MSRLRPLAAWIRRHHLGLLAILILTSGTAYAAAKIDSGDVKNKSLKAKDVKPGTLAGSRVADDSLGTASVDEAQLTLSRVVARIRDSNDRLLTNSLVQHGSVGPWTQRGDELDKILGQAVVSLPAGCNPNRAVQVILVRAGSNFPVSFNGVVGGGVAQSTNSGQETMIVPLSPGALIIPGGNDAGQFEPGVDTQRTLDVHAIAGCGGGSTAFPTITDINLDVIGHR